MLTRNKSRALAMMEHLGLRLRWVPMSVRFRIRGHGHAWRIFTHMTPQERLLLYRLGLQQPTGAVMLEVGSYLGASACFLSAAASEVGGAEVHCVDTWLNQGMTEGERDTWAEFCANTKDFSSIVFPHRGRSVDVAAAFEGEIDLLFLDGDHSYKGCRADVLAWLPHLKPGGVLVMHDYGWAEGVNRVVGELVAPREREPGQVMQYTYWTRM